MWKAKWTWCEGWQDTELGRPGLGPRSPGEDTVCFVILGSLPNFGRSVVQRRGPVVGHRFYSTWPFLQICLAVSCCFQFEIGVSGCWKNPDTFLQNTLFCCAKRQLLSYVSLVVTVSTNTYIQFGLAACEMRTIYCRQHAVKCNA